MQARIITTGSGKGQIRAQAFLFAVLLVFVLTGNVSPVQAVEMPSLYTAEVPLDKDDPDRLNSAYRLALMDVLVRMTGSPEFAQSDEVLSLFPNPLRYVTQYQPGPSGSDTIIVSFDGPEIEQLLRQTGAPVWGAERPLTLVWMAVDRGRGEREIIAADDRDRPPGANRSIDRNKMLRERVQEVAERRGVPIAFPLLDAQDLQNIGFSDIWGGFDDPLLTASERYAAESVLVGRVRSDMRPSNRWTWYGNGERHDWEGSPEDVINALADLLVARDALPGNLQGEAVRLTVSGIHSVRAYGHVQQYLENLRLLDRVMIHSVATDRITYNVELRGGAERLQSALEQARFLVPARTVGIADDEVVNQLGNTQPFASNRVLNYAYREYVRQIPGQDRIRDPRQEPIPNTRQNPGRPLIPN